MATPLTYQINRPNPTSVKLTWLSKVRSGPHQMGIAGVVLLGVWDGRLRLGRSRMHSRDRLPPCALGLLRLSLTAFSRRSTVAPLALGILCALAGRCSAGPIVLAWLRCCRTEWMKDGVHVSLLRSWRNPCGQRCAERHVSALVIKFLCHCRLGVRAASRNMDPGSAPLPSSSM